ncbi:MAG TPA: hypothetical protein PLS49_01685 [Candidatus Woesebacteria bacterium]|nr:hypothetical protein [Candidatus Woesebacteria bacterium]
MHSIFCFLIGILTANENALFQNRNLAMTESKKEQTAEHTNEGEEPHYYCVKFNEPHIGCNLVFAFGKVPLLCQKHCQQKRSQPQGG